ncbi:MAG: Rrf2 family transcriptional regulator [Nitrososphaerota archaeon]|nr:Rrf2 family transcriptional regulator [Nitrososphaerota archaeon]
MHLNVTTDYGIRVVLYLAKKRGVASSSEICANMGIPHTYMHKIVKPLKKAEILREVRGSNGGFVLIKSPNDFSILTIVNAFEKTMNLNKCLEEDKFCSRNASSCCKIRELYVNAQAEFHQNLDVKVSTFLDT